MHPGDIRVVNAVDCEKLGYFVNCLVFSQQGKMPLTSQISGSDLDGVLFNFLLNIKLILFFFYSKFEGFIFCIMGSSINSSLSS